MKAKDLLDFLSSIDINYEFFGDLDFEIKGFSSLNNYKTGSLAWIKSEKNVLLTNVNLKDVDIAISYQKIEGIKNIIITNEGKRAFFSILDNLFSDSRLNDKNGYIGKNTYISENVVLGSNVFIGHNCVLDGDITIGDNSIIWHNVTILNRVEIGERCEIQSGTVIGHDGFGYTDDKEGTKKMIKHYGGVKIHDDVFIGMNNTIARGTIDDTVIGKNTKMADLNHIGHNTKIGCSCTIISSNIYGSCEINNNTYISASVIKNQTEIGGNCIIGMGSIVTKDISDNLVIVGNPAKKLRDNI